MTPLERSPNGSPLSIPKTLTLEALGILVPRLQAFGSTLSQPHLVALSQILGAYSCLASGALSGRFAADLPVGCGKSQSAVAWCAAVYRLGLPFSVAIAASRVESLCDLYRDLEALGIPSDRLGLIHSYGFDSAKAAEWMQTRNPEALGQGGRTSYASLPATQDHHKRQFLLVSHNLIKGRKDVEAFNTFEGRSRDLVIWDESLMVSESRSIPHLGIKKSLGFWAPEVEERTLEGSTPRAALGFLQECHRVVTEETEAQRTGKAPSHLKLPERTEVELEAYLETLGSRDPSKDAVLTPLREMVRMSQGQLRVAQVSQAGSGVISYDIVIPPELRNIVVLDASFNIRELERMDKSIRVLSDFDGQVKRYSQVTINHLTAPSGRESMERSFSQKAGEARKMSREIVDIIKEEIPKDEGVLVFSFKPRGKISIIDQLKNDMAAAGIDLEAQIKTSRGPKPRFAFLTWGMETSISDFQHCRNVLFVGVLHRADHDLAASIVGQRDELLSKITPSLVQEVRRSEIVHALYQAMGRGSARGTTNGEAHSMTVWLTHADEGIRDPLSFVMPGVIWQHRSGRHLKAPESKTGQVAEAILRHLRALPPSASKVYTAKVHEIIRQQHKTSKDIWKAAVQKVAETSPEWSIVGKSFARGAAVFDAA